jgi:hypothetical protein
VRFTIEIVSKDAEHSRVLYRTTIEAIGPKGALSTATTLLAAWRRRGATGARVLNRAGEQIYNWTDA